MKKESPDVQQGDTYSKCKKKKKAKFQTDEVADNYKLVDDFVQDVIERAKSEYLRQCSNHHGDGDVTTKHSPLGDNRRDLDGENGNLLKDTSDDKGGKGKNKRKHNYKYSDPVDEKEISAYQQQEGENLLTVNPQSAQTRPPRRQPLYDRTVSRFRSLISCCLGKS